MKIRLQKEIEKNHSFTSWWDKHSELYENSGVSKKIARTIWRASLDNFTNALEVALKNQ